MCAKGLLDRNTLRVVGKRAICLSYQTSPNRNTILREVIVALAHRHLCYGVGMIYPKLCQRGMVVNHKRVERLYAALDLQVRRCRRKKPPMNDRLSLARPDVANEVWSMDIVLDRCAEGRVIKYLAVVDDATHEAVTVVPERAIGGFQEECVIY